MATEIIDLLSMDDGSGTGNAVFGIPEEETSPSRVDEASGLPIDELTGLPMLTRRTLFGGAIASALSMGGMMLLPKAPGGVLLPVLDALGPKTAYADEEWSGSFTFSVVGTDEVGFLVMDAATMDDKGFGQPVADATVILTKHGDKSKTVKRYTDENGKCIIPIDSIALDPNPKDNVFLANASISITTENARVKMRDFSAGLVTLQGATGVFVATHAIDDTDVYLERCTFDEWDVHYSQNTFLRSKFNNVDHDIFLRFKGTSDDIEVTLNIKDENQKNTIVGPLTATATLNPDSNLVECTFSQHFLQTGDKMCITEDVAWLCFDYTPKGGKTISEPIKVFVEDTPIDEASLNGSIIPFTSDFDSKFKFEASGDWPCFNGLSFSVMNPASIFQYSCNLEAVSIGFGIDINLIDDNNKFSPTGWMKEHKGNIFQRYRRMWDKQVAHYNQVNGKTMPEHEEIEMSDDPSGQAPEPKPDPEKHTLGKQERFLKNFSFNVIFRIVGYMKYSGFSQQGQDLKTMFDGGISGDIGFSAGGSVTIPFQAGPVPMYFSASLTLTAIFSYTARWSKRQLRSVRELDLTDTVINFNNALSLLIKVTLVGSLGAGYKGVCSISCDNTFEFPFLFAWKSDGGDNKADPHITIGVTISMEVVFQCVLFRISASIFSYKKTGWFDNWSKSGDEPALTGDDVWDDIEPRFRLTQPDGSLRHCVSYSNDGEVLIGSEDPFESAVPVTAAMMDVAREADGEPNSKGEAAASDPEEESARQSKRFEAVGDGMGVFKRDDGADRATVVFANALPKPVVHDDGTVETELVYYEGANTFFFKTGLSDEELLAKTATIQASKPVSVGMSSAGPGRRGGVSGSVAYVAVGTATSAGAGSSSSGGLMAVPLDFEERFTGDKMLGFAQDVGEDYVYAPVEGKTTGKRCGPSDIRGIADNDGVEPTIDVVIYQDVHSDPRQRVVSIAGVPYLFRIATVTYTIGKKKYSRSRLVASAFDKSALTWGDPKVIEYNSGNDGLRRIDTYDYDFDIAVRTGNTGWTRDAEACLVVVGGLRPNGDVDKTNIFEAFASPTVSVVLLDENLRAVDRSVQGVADVFGGENDDNAHMLCSPCIVDGFAPKGTSGVLAYAFLHRSTKKNNLIGLTKMGAPTTFNVGYAYALDDHLSVAPDLKVGPELTGDVFGIKGVAGNAVDKQYDALLTLITTRQNGYDVFSATVPSGGSFKDLTIQHNIAGEEVLPEIQPWPHHGTFLFVKERPAENNDDKVDFHLYQGGFDPMKTIKASSFDAKRVDTLNFKGSTFCVSPSGEFVFYNESYRDKPNDDPEADFTSSNVTGSGNDTVYRIAASRFMNGSFCEDFPFCEVDHPIDRLEVLDISDDASSFVATHITNADQSLADLHYIAVPNTLAAEIEGFAAAQPFVYAGKSCDFQLDVRNHGNLIISGFDVQMIDPDDGSVIGTVSEDSLKLEKMSLNASNMGWGNHDASSSSPSLEFTAEEKKGWLMPGKLVSYHASFNIPKEWKDEKRVIMKLLNYKTPGVSVADLEIQGAIATQAGFSNTVQHPEFGRAIHYYHDGTDNTVKLQSDMTAEASIQNPVAEVKEDKRDPDGQGSTRSSVSAITPKTDDSLGALGPLGVALGGAAALLAGYSARRVRNEREQQQQEGGKD